MSKDGSDPACANIHARSMRLRTAWYICVLHLRVCTVIPKSGRDWRLRQPSPTSETSSIPQLI